MSGSPRRELEDLLGAENAKELTAVGNELESLELNSGDLASCVDEVAKPGQVIPGLQVLEVCTSEIETATKPSAAHSSGVSSPSRYSSPSDATSASFRMLVTGTTLCDILDFPTSSGVQHEKRMYV
jgi:hypothetical protein